MNFTAYHAMSSLNTTFSPQWSVQLLFQDYCWVLLLALVNKEQKQTIIRQKQCVYYCKRNEGTLGWGHLDVFSPALHDESLGIIQFFIIFQEYKLYEEKVRNPWTLFKNIINDTLRQKKYIYIFFKIFEQTYWEWRGVWRMSLFCTLVKITKMDGPFSVFSQQAVFLTLKVRVPMCNIGLCLWETTY